MDHHDGSSTPSLEAVHPRIVCLSLHLPDPVPDNAGVAYLGHLVEVLGKDDVFVIAPDGAMNRRASERDGIGTHVLVPAARRRGPRFWAPVRERWERARPVRPPAEFLKYLLANPRLVTMIGEAEIIDLQWPAMSALVSEVRKHAPRARIIVTPHDVSSQRFRRQLAAASSPVQKLRLQISVRQAKRIERVEFRKADTVVVFSDKDRGLLPVDVPATVISVPIPAPQSTSSRPPRSAITVALVGPLSRPENWDAAVWMVDAIWPTVREALPEARLVIAGKVSEDQRVRLERTPNVDVLGFVDDLDALYAETTAVVAPLRLGAGVKFKALDALVRGIPLITTSVGAEGIGDSEYSVPVADDEQAFAEAVIACLGDSAGAHARAAQAQRWARDRYSPAVFRRAVERVYGATSSPLQNCAGLDDFDPEVTVVIPVRNGELGLGYELAALARQPEAKGIEVIVSDNGSADRTRDVALAYGDAFGALRIVDSSDRPGVSHARNIGIVAARGRKVLICDHDDEVREGWIAALSAGLDRADVVGGRAISSSISGAQRALEVEQDDAPATREVFGYLPYVLGGCMGVRRDAALAIGGFDETFVRGHEEVDFCWRLQQSGYTLEGIPEAVLDYRQRDRAIDAARQRFHSARTQILLWERHHTIAVLRPVSFKGSIRHALSSVLQLPRLIPRSSRFRTARRIGWAFGTLDGHLRYRILGDAPSPALLPIQPEDKQGGIRNMPTARDTL